MKPPSRSVRKTSGEPTGKRDQSGRFAPKAGLTETARAATADYPALQKARLTMPEPDFTRLRVLKERLKNLDRPTRKNELLRAGLQALAALSDEALLLAVEQLPPAKPPKPPKAPKQPKSPKPMPKAAGRKQPAARTKPAARARKSRAAIDN